MCSDDHKYFNHEHHSCADRWCSVSCGERNCYDRADRCFDACPHDLVFNHEDDVDFNGESRPVGTCMCHEEH